MRVNKMFTLTPEAAKMLKEYAEKNKTKQSFVIEKFIFENCKEVVAEKVVCAKCGTINSSLFQKRKGIVCANPECEDHAKRI